MVAGHVPGATSVDVGAERTLVDRCDAPTGPVPTPTVIAKATAIPALTRTRPAGIPPYLRWVEPQTALLGRLQTATLADGRRIVRYD